MEAKRKFQPSRLYKLIKRTVIVVTILSAITAIYMAYNVYADKQDEIKYGFEAIRQCGSEYTSSGDINNCFNSIMQPYNSNESIANDSLLITIFLPLIFFGGTGIYRYLFPKQKK
jgi:hypothetical protein